MPDKNEIRVSYDQRSAVRLRDLAELVAVPDQGWGRKGSCDRCSAPQNAPQLSCMIKYAKDFRLCHPSTRADRMCIHWERR